LYHVSTERELKQPIYPATVEIRYLEQLQSIQRPVFIVRKYFLICFSIYESV